MAERAWDDPGVLHVVFVEPRIAGNTGNAIRMVSGTGATLHLVEPLGFDLAEAKLRRAGLDYHDLAHVEVHPDLDHLLAALPGSRLIAFTTKAPRWFTEVEYRPDDALVFGPEPTGLSDEVLARLGEQVRIPMLPGRRSMNLSNAAAVATYEAWRQLGHPGGA